MRLGISSYTYAWAVGVPGAEPEQPISAVDLVDCAVALGVGVVQIADNLPLHELGSAELEALMVRAARAHVSIEVGTRGIRPERLGPYLHLARRLGSPLLRTVIDLEDDRPSPEEAAQCLRGQMADFAAAGVVLAIENHDRFSVTDLLDLLQRVGSEHVGICLDTVNSFGALEGPAAVISALAPHTVNLHVKDFAVVRHSHQMGFSIEGRPAGQGRLDVPALLDALDRADRDCNAILELWTPATGNLAATLAREADWARQSVAYLRGFIAE